MGKITASGPQWKLDGPCGPVKAHPIGPGLSLPLLQFPPPERTQRRTDREDDRARAVQARAADDQARAERWIVVNQAKKHWVPRSTYDLDDAIQSGYERIAKERAKGNELPPSHVAVHARNGAVGGYRTTTGQPTDSDRRIARADFAVGGEHEVRTVTGSPLNPSSELIGYRTIGPSSAPHLPIDDTPWDWTWWAIEYDGLAFDREAEGRTSWYADRWSRPHPSDLDVRKTGPAIAGDTPEEARAEYDRLHKVEQCGYGKRPAPVWWNAPPRNPWTERHERRALDHTFTVFLIWELDKLGMRTEAAAIIHRFDLNDVHGRGSIFRMVALQKVAEAMDFSDHKWVGELVDRGLAIATPEWVEHVTNLYRDDF